MLKEVCGKLQEKKKYDVNKKERKDFDCLLEHNSDDFEAKF